MERRVLGKGLSALITPEPVTEEKNVVLLDPDKIVPNRYQPRLVFKEDKLQELVDSIREKGVVQPVIVRKNQNNEYELIAGERRLRAVKVLQCKEIPAIIKEATDKELLELSIIENIQRDDLNPLEEAKAYEALMRDFGFTQEQVAQTIGKNRATVANILRLLSLPEKVKAALFKELISFGHAKAILGLQSAAEQILLCERVIKQNLSVRESEFLAGKQKDVKKAPGIAEKDEHVKRLEDELQHIFGTKVQVIHGKKRGKVQIEYYSLDDLERVLSIVRKQ